MEFQITCRVCHTPKSKTDFYGTKEGRIFSACKECYKKTANNIKYREKYKKVTYYKTKSTFKRYERNAKDRNLAFDLTIDDFKKIKKFPCYYCGDKPKRIGIDRVNNDLGYIQGNCVQCCIVCNRMKMNHTLKFFLDHIDKIKERMRIEHLKLKIA